MRRNQIAFQLWTVRSLIDSVQGLADALGAARRIGFRHVQLAGHGELPPAEVRKVLDDTGVAACSSHEDSREILESPGRVAERLHLYGCQSVAYPYPRDQELSTREGIRRLCRALAKAGKLFRSEGILFAYHHHHLEFQKVGGRAAMDIILDEVDPGLLQIEPDTYWLQAGGVDPVQWLRRHGRRETLLHLKDYGVDSRGAPRCCEIGAGNLEWDRILPAARRGGCRWYIVEQDDSFRTGDPLASLAESFRFLSKMCRGGSS